jgi:hypothetical protein
MNESYQNPLCWSLGSEPRKGFDWHFEDTYGT